MVSGPLRTHEGENDMSTIKYDCIANMIQRYERATHGYYFSNDTMKFFSGKVYEPVYRIGDTEVFVDSIRDTWGDQPRQYRVKEWCGSDAGIVTITKHKTLRSAEKAARRHAEALAKRYRDEYAELYGDINEHRNTGGETT